MKYDVAVIGSGPGGYVAAIRCAQLGLNTVLVEKNNVLGGTCLNVGCIPTKTLLEMTSHLHEARHQFARYGIEIGEIGIDYPKMINRKNTVIQQNAKGIESLLQKNNVSVLNGTATFVTSNSLQISNNDGAMQVVEMEKAIIASGSIPFSLPFAAFDHQRILSSSDLLSIEHIPESLLIVGAGVIGLELGTVFKRLGTQIDILEITDSVLPNFDSGLCKEVLRPLKKLGIKFQFGCRVENILNRHDKVVVSACDNKQNLVELEADYCLMATGRKPNIENLGLETINIALNAKGSIKVDENLKTSHDNIYAIGDVTGGIMLAHKASEEAVFVAEHLAGLSPATLNYKAIPSVVYTSPEAAFVGYTEEELKNRHVPYKVGICQNRALGRAHTADKLDGFAKVLLDSEKGTILGVHLVAPHASEMIGEAVLAFEQKMTGTDLAQISHAHPTYLEAIKEACLLAVNGRGIHVI